MMYINSIIDILIPNYKNIKFKSFSKLLNILQIKFICTLYKINLNCKIIKYNSL